MKPFKSTALEHDLRVVVVEHLLVVHSAQRHAVGADLAHPHAMPPPLPREDEGLDVAVLVALAIDEEQGLAQSEKRLDPETVEVEFATTADHGHLDDPPRGAALARKEVDELAD